MQLPLVHPIFCSSFCFSPLFFILPFPSPIASEFPQSHDSVLLWALAGVSAAESGINQGHKNNIIN